MKQNVLLAKVEHLAPRYRKMITDFTQFFKNKQTDFKGIRKTYSPKEGTIDEPSKRGNVLVVTTVEEKFKWFEEEAAEYIDHLFAVEATNASGTVRAELKVGDVSFGTFSTLELLRLKSLLEAGGLEDMYANIPVRADSETWEPTKEEMYKDRQVYEAPLSKGISKSIVKESYIMTDPNIEKVGGAAKYQPIIGTKDTIVDLGEYTVQHFSGEGTHRERAEILKRRSQLLNSVIETLKIANDQEHVTSAMTSKKLFGFLHKGTI